MGVRPALRSLALTAAVVAPLAAAVVWLVHAPGVVGSAPDGAGPDGVREIAVRVHAWGFSPRVVHVKPGQTVRFVARSEDIQHGLAINELGVNLPLAPGGAVRSAAVAVDLPEGVYAIHCSVFCGLGHPSMKAKLVVGTPRPAPGAAAPWIASLLAAGMVAGAAAAALAGRGP